MKNCILVIMIVSLAFNVYSQHDEVAKTILDKVSAKTESYASIKADFTYTMQNTEADVEEVFTGTAFFKGNMYKLILASNEISSDGVTKWVYLEDAGEVQISNIADQIEDGEENFLNDPTKILKIYEQGFKYKYIGEKTIGNVLTAEIELVPEDLEKPYFKIKVFVNKAKDQVKTIKYFAKDGSRYLIEINDFITNNTYEDEFFIFDISKYDDVIEVDLRE